MNLTGFFAMKLDKSRAKAKAWRISEKTLFMIAFFGGSIGIWAGMYQFHHKTKHWYFKFGIPFILFVELIGAYYIFR